MKIKTALLLLTSSLLALSFVALFKHLGTQNLSEPAAGSLWTEPTTGMQFVWIPTGCFQMGSAHGRDDEKPIHRVCVKGFYLGKYEVTQGQYEKVVGSNPCAKHCSHFVGADRAVAYIRWDDAQKMIAELQRKLGERFRLPSEAEWEYACVAGGRHREHCGDGRLEDVAWIDQAHYGGSADGPRPVGLKQPNAWGLFDMNGNVAEYVQDCWHGNYAGAHRDGSARVDGDCFVRVYRGGSWETSGPIRATTRGYLAIDSELLPSSNGFRLVRLVQ